MDLVLERYSHSEQGTFGRLFLPELSLDTVERPWAGNAPWVSCIPEGRYEMQPVRFRRGGYDTFEVMNVPERTHILVHVANRAIDVQGCIGVGMLTGCVAGEWAVLESHNAFAAFMEAMKSVEAPALVIRSRRARRS